MNKKNFDFTIEENYEYVYLLQPIGYPNMVKYGSMANVHARFRECLKGNNVVYLKKVKNCRYVEKEITRIFSAHFTYEPKHGGEYFSGNVELMKQYVDEIINQTQQFINE